MDLAHYLSTRRDVVEQALEDALPPRHPDPTRLVEAMRYTMLLPGKRLRGIICLAVAEIFDTKAETVLPLAVATEMVHAASLILDDLPAFDDARLRRGARSNHRVFGESTAMLATVGLLSAAYRHLAQGSRRRLLGRDETAPSLLAIMDAVGEAGMI